MKRFVATVIALKLVLVAGFFTLFVYSQGGNQNAPVVLPTPPVFPETSNHLDRPVSDPYTGDLSIFEDGARAKNLQIERVMDILNIKDKQSVADIGAGSGWFSVRAAKRTGTGTVYAVEINQDYIAYINKRAKKEKFSNIKTVLGKPNDPMLPANSVDSVMLLKTYHEIAEPIALMKSVKKSLKTGGLVGIIDKNGSGDDHGLDQDKVVSEMKLAGFTLKESYDFVKPDGMDYFLVFEVSK